MSQSSEASSLPAVGTKWRSGDHRNAGCPWLLVLAITPKWVVVQRHEDEACSTPRGRPVPTRHAWWTGAGAPSAGVETA